MGFRRLVGNPTNEPSDLQEVIDHDTTTLSGGMHTEEEWEEIEQYEQGEIDRFGNEVDPDDPPEESDMYQDPRDPEYGLWEDVED